MAQWVTSTMTVSQGTILNYTYNTDNGYASSLRFAAAPDYSLPSLFNYGEMRYQWSGTSAAWFITFSPEFMWNQAVFENYGTISLVAANAALAKVFTSENYLPHIYNQGTISVQAKGSALIAEGWNSTQHITNAAGGVMRATAQEQAFCLYLNNGGTVENAGQIIATTTGGANVGRGAFGISMMEGVGNIHNSGLIEASDGDSTTKYSTAISFSGNSVTIVNDGTLRGNYAIYADGAQIVVENNNLLDGEVSFGDGHDILANNGNIIGLADLGGGNDLYDGRLGTISGDVFGGEGYDRLNGGAGGEHLLGEDGEDRIWGGAGADDLDGGAGEDIFVYVSAAESTAAVRDRIRAFQTGLDTIELRYLSVSGISWAQQSDGTGSYNLVTVATAAGTLSIRVDGTLAMSDFTIVEDRQLTGTSGGDTLTGGAGNDMLDGLGGADQMAGKAGDDIYHVDNAGDVILETEGKYYETAFDTVLASVSYTLTAGAWVEMLSASDPSATAPLALTGNALGQTITGNAGANSLAGGGGVDTLVGLGGDDSYYIGSTDVTVREAVGGGNDIVIVQAGMFYRLTAGAEVELLTIGNDAGASYVQLIGNEFNQTLLGNADANGLGGEGGNDRLVGGGGADGMGGGEGSDVYVYLNASDSVSGAADLISLSNSEDFVDLIAVHATAVSWIEYPGWISDFPSLLRGYVATIETPGGTMTIKIIGRPFRTDFLLGTELLGTAGADTMQGGVNADVIAGREGNDFLYGLAGADVLAGQAGNDVIDGGAGADQMIGGLGDDIYYVDDANDLAWEEGPGGTDVVIASASYTLAPRSYIEILQTADQNGTAAIDLAGNTNDNLIIGNAGNNILDGGVNTDPINFSYGGSDTLRGLGGNDTYYVDTVDDVVVELAGQGDDIVYARYTYVLTAGASVETLAAADPSSSATLNLTGNEFGQRIVGNAGNNVILGGGGGDLLIGGAGDDRLGGGAGNDRLEGGAGADIFVFTATGDSRFDAMRSDGVKSMPDVIVDFTAGADRIDLSGIDAAVGTAQNDAFIFIGTGAFTHQAGQLRYEANAGGVSIYADVDGDGFADLQIIALTPTLTAADFIL